ncbi:hypothetical protein EVA_14378 [gut metagenome]|uniref:Uncharacterized protein n=1 Tax=gut metagenome TaxID=749906 RepID=J9CC42_9ZZZZ
MSLSARGFINTDTPNIGKVEIALAFFYPMTEYCPYPIGILLYSFSY